MSCNFSENEHHEAKVLASFLRRARELFITGEDSRLDNNGAQSPMKKFSVCVLTELILKSKVSQNTENPKLGLLVI